MSDPLVFDTASPRYSLPLLFAGQAQKEIFVNEAHALTDALLHCAIEGQSAAPPATVAEGENWLVDAAPAGEWVGHAGEIACRQSGNWLFVAPRDGLRVFDRSTGQTRHYANGWHAPATPPLPSGGATIDSEARDAITALIAVLEEAGILVQP